MFRAISPQLQEIAIYCKNSNSIICSVVSLKLSKKERDQDGANNFKSSKTDSKSDMFIYCNIFRILKPRVINHEMSTKA